MAAKEFSPKIRENAEPSAFAFSSPVASTTPVPSTSTLVLLMVLPSEPTKAYRPEKDIGLEAKITAPMSINIIAAVSLFIMTSFTIVTHR